MVVDLVLDLLPDLQFVVVGHLEMAHLMFDVPELGVFEYNL